MKRSLDVDLQVWLDLNAHADYYECQVPGLGGKFAKAVDKAFAFLQRFPDANPPYRRRTRLAKVPKFPIAIIYRVHRRAIHVFAVFHLRSEPRRWPKA